jgi:hypothetical protein
MDSRHFDSRSPLDFGAWTAVLVFVSIYAPQFHYYGQGHWAAYALFVLWCLNVVGRPSFERTLVTYHGRFALLVLFLAIVVATYTLRGGSEPHRQFIDGAITCTMAFTVAGHYAHSRPRTLRRILQWTVILLGLAILPSLPLLHANPGIARPLATGDETYTAYFGYNPEIMRDGVGSFSLYTIIAISSPCWIGLIPGLSSRGKIAMVAALGALMAAVALSTFTMAAGLLLGGVCICAVGAPFVVRSRHRWPAILTAAVLLFLLPPAISCLHEESEAFTFVYDKTLRLLDDFSQAGLLKGDTTGRAEAFLESLDSFQKNPLWGVGFGVREGVSGGHCSLVDHWAVFGLLGYWPWFLLQAYCTWIPASKWLVNRRDLTAFSSTVSWGLYWVASASNPVAFSVLPALLIFTDCYLQSAARRSAPAVSLGRWPRPAVLPEGSAVQVQ